MKKGDKVALVCCSNGQDKSHQDKLLRLHDILECIGLSPIFSPYTYARNLSWSGTARERAESLMGFYQDKEIKAIFDISGGDLANEVLPYLDFSLIRQGEKLFWGYSDLTTIINAIYAKTSTCSVLYQIRNLLYENSKEQIENFSESVMQNEMKVDGRLFDFRYTFFQKKEMRGIVVGGNIRCLLKLAGTSFWPEMKGKILLLESLSGNAARIASFFNQLQQMGVFQEVSGVLLGTFTDLCGAGKEPIGAAEMLCQYAGADLAIAYTAQIGHGPDSKAVVIGKEYELGQ